MLPAVLIGKKELRTSLYLKLAIQKLTPLMEDF